MKKMTKQLLVAAVALMAFTACSDSVLSESGTADRVLDNQPMNTAILTDASGQQVASVSPNVGTYYLDIKTDGIWYIECGDNMEFTPTRMFGRGSMRVPVIIGNNWAQPRQLTYNVKFFGENGQPLKVTTRAGEGQTLSQDALLSLDRFKKVINSNVFVGYGYNATKNPVPELCTGIQIFEMETLNGTDTLVKPDLSPQTQEESY